MFLYILLILLVSLLFYLKWDLSELPPGPFGVPILGYLPWLDPKAPHETLTKLSKKYGRIFGLSLGSVYTVVLTDPKMIRSVFSKDSTTGRAPLYLTHGIMKGYGLICAEGELWKNQRRFVHNCLRQLGGTKVSPQKEKMESVILENALEFVNYLKELGDPVIFDPLDALRHSLGSVMNITVFGKSYPKNDTTWKWLQHLQEEGTKHIGVAGPLNFLPFCRFLPKFKQTMNFLIDGKHATHKVYRNIIDEQNELLEKQSDELEPCSNFTQAFLIERRKRQGTDEVDKFFNDQQFYHLLADVFGAGLDTTLTTLRWYLLFLATNKDMQQKIRSEIVEVLQGRSVSMVKAGSMPLMEASIAEAQRIRSVVPLGIPHGTVEEMEIDGYRIPKGTMLVPLQWAIHMDQSAWKEPHKFDPMRFINGEGKFVKPDNFIPFQTGKRMCVGDELARMMLFLFCTVIVQNFIIDVDHKSNVDLNGECGITLNPKPHELKFSSVEEV